jgi:D-alanyl-D-alanine carboxypeptidase
MYEPLDWVTLDRAVGSNNKMRKEASTHLEELLSYAEENGHIMYPYSAYRSYDEQSRLYTNYKNRDGEEEADTYSARPGFSDHQTGLTTDIRSSNLGDRLNDDDLEFMINNSYKYGFILRYPEGKENITRYVYENWHYRYVGKEAAKIIHDNDLTLDEYYDLYVKEY